MTTTSYSAGTIQRSATILANTGASLSDIVALIAAAQNRVTVSPVQVPVAPVVRSIVAPRNPTSDALSNNVKNWRTAKPSQAQVNRNRSEMARINRAETILGYRLSTFHSLNNGKACKFTAGAYSDFRTDVLKPLRMSLEVEVSAL